MLNYSNSVIPFKLLLFLHCKHLPNRFIVLISSRYMKSDTNFSFLYSAKTWRWWTYLLVLHVGGCCLFVLLFYLKFLDLNSEDEIQKCNNILIPITAGDENRQLFLAHYKTGSHAYLLLSLLLFFSRFALFFHLKCLDLFKMEIRFILMRSQPIKCSRGIWKIENSSNRKKHIAIWIK